MQPLSSFSRAWMHVQYRAQSLLPCPFYHKSQSSEASNHKARMKQPSFHSSLTPFSIVFFEKPPYRTKMDGRRSCVKVHLRLLWFNELPRCKEGGCLGLQAALANDLPWSTSMVCSVERTSPKPQRSRYHRRHRNGEGSQIVTTSIFCIQGQYQNYNLQKATNTN
jgi:hypothetical protein